ncbi:hypothetical protein J4F81_000804 [Campylobacter jejuni]|nr:hypothetical protein [Campylobacter jejuni]EBF5430356.1 hypothetical protein [Campylobacter jejuni]ECZ3460738.1 hypothetical protein [Campylobacter jejuni]EGS8922935.1 hypothetical protein [Campylobacter jejuni]EHF8864462.1 hypothetical protein [Campylobacter jejuni]
MFITATAPNPLVLYFLSPLEIKSTPNASTFMGWSFGLVFLEFLLMRLVWLCLGCLWC